MWVVVIFRLKSVAVLETMSGTGGASGWITVPVIAQSPVTLDIPTNETALRCNLRSNDASRSTNDVIE